MNIDKNNRQVKPSKVKKPSRTGGYYGFRKNYPTESAQKGSYPVEVQDEKMTLKAKLLTAAAALLIFIIAFVAVRVALELSSRTPKSVTAGITGVYEEEAAHTAVADGLPDAEG